MIPTKEQIDEMGRREKHRVLGILAAGCACRECAICEHAQDTSGPCEPKAAMEYILKKLGAGVNDDVELYGGADIDTG
jgi:hypothetical protein